MESFRKVDRKSSGVEGDKREGPENGEQEPQEKKKQKNFPLGSDRFVCVKPVATPLMHPQERILFGIVHFNSLL